MTTVLADWNDAQLAAKFGDVMDTIERINNTAGLADLARRASEIWAEIQQRGGADPETARERVKRPIPDHCDYDDCIRRPLWSVQHEEYADHLPPDFACGLHLSKICAQAEYEEGDTLIVDRVRFSV